MKTKYIEVKSGERTLRGMKHISQKNKEFVFLIIHGYFTSNKIGPHRLYVKIADALCSQYGDCYRFDLTGMGESDGDISNVTLNTHIEDLCNILEYITKTEGKEVIVVSHCMGCNLILDAILSKKYIFREIIFVAPYFTNEEILKLFFTNQQQIYDLYAKGHTYRNGLYADRSFFLDKTFYDSFINLINDSQNYINIIAASDDQYIPFACNEKLRHDSQNVNFSYIPDADHNFLTKQNELIEKIFELLDDNKFTNHC